ncbi:PTP type protein phosphatase [Trinorchestia longiramus]|nr:PTP type protein phosphatase [Trinorchestia longiramus]
MCLCQTQCPVPLFRVPVPDTESHYLTCPSISRAPLYLTCAPLSHVPVPESRIVCQFHYSLWPDHGVPESVKPLLAMVRLVRECQASETLPLLVHCSAGCGRTGTICAIDHVWTLLRTGRLPDSVDLLAMVKEMRRQRVAMVQTRDQYVLLHRAVRHLFKDRLALIDEHPYANICLDGSPLGLHTSVAQEGASNHQYTQRNVVTASGNCVKPQHASSNGYVAAGNGYPVHQSAQVSGRSCVVKSGTTPQSNQGDSNGYAGCSSDDVAANCSQAGDAPRSKPRELSFTPASGLKSPISSPQNPPPKRFQEMYPPSDSSPASPMANGDRIISTSCRCRDEKCDCSVRGNQAHQTSDQSSVRVDSPVDEVDFSSESGWRLKQKYKQLKQQMQQQYKQQQLLAKCSSSPQSTPYSTPISTPQGGTPSATPNTTPNPMQGIGLLSPPQPPTPPTRSQTPSPVIALNKKVYESFQQHQLDSSRQHHHMLDRQHQESSIDRLGQQNSNSTLSNANPNQPLLNQYRRSADKASQRQQFPYQKKEDSFPQTGVIDSNNYHSQKIGTPYTSEKKPRKSMELNRRPSIQKLKQLFETSKPVAPVVECPDDVRRSPSNVKLSRSASSVTLRASSLSLASDSGAKSVRLRRRPGLGSEESINLLHVQPDLGRPSQLSDPQNKNYSNLTGALRICPPPPPIYGHCKGQIDLNRELVSPDNSNQFSGTGGVRENSVYDSGRSSKPPSFPSHPSPNSKRRQHLRDQLASSAHSRTPSDDRPALPVKIKKKSQSFRYSREQTPSSDPGNRSPEFSRKTSNEVNTYFSLERAKAENYDGVSGKNVRGRNEPTNTPSCVEFKKLAVFPSNESRSLLVRPPSFQDEDGLRPQIPPKKSAQNRVKVGSCENFSCSSPSVEVHDRSPSSSGKEQRVGSIDGSPTHKSSFSSDSDQSLYDQLPCPTRQNHSGSTAPKPYVNARFVRVADPVEGERCVYVPMPSRRKASEKISPDYANYSADDKHRSDLAMSFGQSCAVSSPQSPSINLSPKSVPGSTTSIDRSPVEDDRPEPLMLQSLDDVSAFRDKNYANASFMKSVEELHTVSGALASANKAVYEPIDFGEHSDDVSDDDVVEVVNKEIVGERYRSDNPCAHPICLPNEDSLRSSLDSIARQVYQDCENYLLHGSNKSAVPSLMPSDSKSSLKRPTISSQNISSPRSTGDATYPTSPTRSSASSLESQKVHRPMEGAPDSFMSEVKNRVSIAPHGLRTRERSNSYRQAVRNVSSNWKPNKRNFAEGNSSRKDPMAPYIVESPEECQTESPSECSDFESPRKSVHKYETIWFEKIKETSKSDENLRLSRNLIDENCSGTRSIHSKSSGGTLGHPLDLDQGNACVKWDESCGSVSVGNRERNSIGTPPVFADAKNDDLRASTNSLERRHASKESLSGNSGTSSSGSKTFYTSSMKGNSRESLENIDLTTKTSVPSSTKYVGDYYMESREPIYVNTSDLRASTLQHHKNLSSVRPCVAGSNTGRDNCNSNSSSSNSLRSPCQENEVFSLITKPQGPSPTTPSKQGTRTPNTPYMAIPQPKGLGTPPEGAHPMSPGSPPKPANFGDQRMKSYEKFLSESGQSRSLPPPPPPTSFKSKNPHQHFPSMERTAPYRPHPGAMLEPLYNIPVDAKRELPPKNVHHGSRNLNALPNNRNFNDRGDHDEGNGNRHHGSARPGGHMSRSLHGPSVGGVDDLYASKAHIVGDVAIVGDSAVRLRRQPRPQDRAGGDGPSQSGGRDPYSVPVAPPRVKRHSSVGAGADNTTDARLGEFLVLTTRRTRGWELEKVDVVRHRRCYIAE